MVSREGKILKWKDIFIDNANHHPAKIQICLMENGRRLLHIFKPISFKEKQVNATFYPPSYRGIKAIINGLIEIDGREKVEKELGIKVIEK